MNNIRPLRIALTKGRLETKSIESFEFKGIDCTELRNKGRKLVFSLDFAGVPVDVILVKSVDVITYVENGFCDIGIVGKDSILEFGKQFYEVKDLQYGKCKIVFAGMKSLADNPDLWILDIMLPDIDGFGVCQLMRKKSAVPIIFLSAMDGEEQLVKGYDCLADDYVTKPFSMPILLRKIAAIFRRNDITDRKDDSQQITYKKLLIDRELMEVTVNGRKVNLTVREFNLLCLFAEHPGHVYSREMIIDSVWSYNDAVEDRVVDSHIKNLRQKIGGEYIETVRGIGYRAAK